MDKHRKTHLNRGGGINFPWAEHRNISTRGRRDERKQMGRSVSSEPGGNITPCYRELAVVYQLLNADLALYEVAYGMHESI